MRYWIITYTVLTLTAFAAFGTTNDTGTGDVTTPSAEPTDILYYLKLNNIPLDGFPDTAPQNGTKPKKDTDRQNGPKYTIGAELNSFATVSLTVDVNKAEDKNKPEDKNKAEDVNKAANLKELLEKIRDPYIIRAQVKGKNVTTDVWQNVFVFNVFTRTLAKEPVISREVLAVGTEPARNGGTPAESAGAQVEAPGSSFMEFYIKPEIYDIMPYLKNEKYVTVIDPGLLDSFAIESVAQAERAESLEEDGILNADDVKVLNRLLYSGPQPGPTIGPKAPESGWATRGNTESYWEPGEIEAVRVKLENTLYDPTRSLTDHTRELIKDTLNGDVIIEELTEKKRFLETEKEVFFFNAANCYVSDNDGNLIHYKAKDGDTLRIQIFRVGPLLTDRPDAKPMIPEFKHELYFKFREYGWYVNVSPASFFVTDVNRNNFNTKNFNPIDNTPGIGANVYFTYVGISGTKNILVNYIAPSLAFAVVGYYDKPTETVDPASPEAGPKKNEAKFAAGLSWPIIPIVPWLRDMVNLSILIYDLDFDHVLVGVSLSPKFNMGKLFNGIKDDERPKSVKSSKLEL